MSRVDEAVRRAAGLTAVPAPVRNGDFPQEAAVPITEYAREEQGAIQDQAEPKPPAKEERRAPPPRSSPEQPLLDRIDERLANKVVVDGSISPLSREQYRRLAGTLHHMQGVNGLKVILIASAVAGEGKTLTAANLALTLSESYQRTVLLVDADLRKPALHTIFNIDRPFGLNDGLISEHDRRMPASQLSKYLSVLTAGSPSVDPMAGLISERMRRLVAEARDSFEWVIIDTPPIAVLPDAGLLASMTDGVVLVIKADATPYDLVRRAVESLGPDRVLGTVLNRTTTPPHTGSGYGYEYSYGAYARAGQPD